MATRIQLELFLPTFFLFLVPDIRSNRLFVSTDRGHEVSPGPKVLPDEVARPPRKVPGDVEALFPLIYPITCATEYFGGIDNMM